MHARSTLALLAATSSLGLAACGSSSSGGSAALSRTQLATKADSICATAKNAAGKIPQPTTLAKASDAAKYLEQIQPITRKEATDLAALKPDSEAKADWNALVAGENTLANLLDDIVKKAKANDVTGLKELQGSAATGKPFVDAATKIGAKGCATG